MANIEGSISEWLRGGSWLLAPGSWLLSPGSWLVAGSWLLAPGSDSSAADKDRERDPRDDWLNTWLLDSASGSGRSGVPFGGLQGSSSSSRFLSR